MKIKLITLALPSCIVFYTNLAYGIVNNNSIDDKQIISGSTYHNIEATLMNNSSRENLTLTGETLLRVQGGSQVSNTKVEDNSNIQMQQYGYNNKLGTPIIQDTTVNGMGSIDMGAGSVSLGQLYIEKNARLTIDNTDMNSTDVLVNSPAPAARVYIERLTLTGKAEIGPAWIGDGEDGDATLPESPGPMLVTSIDNLKMEHGSKLSMLPYGSAVQFNQLNIKELSGTGNFYLTTSLADGISDKIHVSEHATGNFGLQVNDSGREIMTPHNTQLVYINSGDAKFNLLNDNGIVEAGVWQYKLYNKTENGHTEWFLAGRNPEDLPPAETDNGTGNPEGNNTPPLLPDYVK